jgi:MFS superfamily sulfate permease-like transporter
VLTPAGTTGNNSLVVGSTTSLIMTGTSRWPAAYTARELQLGIIVLFAAVVVASCLQLVVIGLWKMLKFSADDKPK